MKRFTISIIVVLATMTAGIAPPACATELPEVDLSTLDRGHRLFAKYGFQLHGVAFLGSRATNPFPDDPVDLTTLGNANFNGINFGSTDWDKIMWTPPTGNYNWSRWSTTPESNPTQEGLVMASVLDERILADTAVVAEATASLSYLRDTLPNVIGYVTDNGKDSGSLADIKAYMLAAQPDMLFWNHYVFGGVNSKPDPWPGGSPTIHYSMLGKYREAARAGINGDFTKPIPVGMWIQTYRPKSATYPAGYVLSNSELSLQYGSAWAYGYKALFSFTYATNVASDPDGDVRSVFFDGPGDTNPTPSYFRVAELNRQTQNLAPALLTLKSDSVRFVPGRHAGNIENDIPAYTSRWQSSDDPYMTNITATNAGIGTTVNGGMPGDIVVGYFKTLDEGFDGPSFSDELYFMITNGLTDPNGDEFETRQQVQLDFDFGATGITSLQRLSRDTGLVETVPLVFQGGSSYSLDFFLLGGEGDLFKYNTGAPFSLLQESFQWGSSASGDWQDASNWSSNAIPNSNDKTVFFGSVITADRTVLTDSAVTAQGLQFDSVNSYVLAGLGSVNLQNTLGNATIDVFQGSHKFQVVVNLNTETDVDIASGASLVFSNTLNLNGNNLNKTGLGTMQINNTLNTGGGVISLAAGSVAGSGLIEGDVINLGGTLAPGNSPGTLTIAGNYTQESGATLSIELSGVLQGIEYDLLNVAGMLALHGGTLEVVLLDDFNPSDGDVFDILDFSKISGAGFDSLNLPSLDAGFAWDTSNLSTSGALSVSAVPEPSTFVLLCGALACVFGRRTTRSRCNWQEDLVRNDVLPMGTKEQSHSRMKPARLASIIALLVVVGGWASFAHAVSFVEPFDGLAPGDIVGQNGWQTVDGFIGNLFSSSGLVESPTVPGVSFDGSDSTSPGESSNGFGQAMARDINSTTDIFGGQYVVQVDLRLTSSSTFRFGIGTSASIITGGPAEMNWLQVAGDGVIGLQTFNDEDFIDVNTFNPVASVVTGFDVLSGINPANDWMQVRATVDAATGVATLDYRKLGTLPWFNAGVSGGALTGVGSQVQAMEISVQDSAQVDNVIVGTGSLWNAKSSGDWNAPSNWASFGAPNGNTSTAQFAAAISTPRTVFTDSDVTVKSITFGDANAGTIQQSYGIAGQGIVTLEADAGNANITVLEGSHQFQAAVTLGSITDMNASSGTTLTLNGVLNLGANDLNLIGAGTIAINNNLNTGTGSVNASAGTILGNGTISGDLNNNGAMVAPGMLTIAGNYLQASGSLEIEINGISNVSGNRQYDLLNVAGNLTISGGSLDVVMGFTPTPGDTFNVLDFASINLSGATLNLGTPGVGLLWDSSQLAIDGSLSVISDLLGDFDVDGDVDGNDFLAWQRGFGTSFDSTDLADWEGNFGAPPLSALSGASAAVPEPASAYLLIIALGALALVVHRRTSVCLASVSKTR